MPPELLQIAKEHTQSPGLEGVRHAYREVERGVVKPHAAVLLTTQTIEHLALLLVGELQRLPSFEPGRPIVKTNKGIRTSKGDAEPAVVRLGRGW